MNSGATVVDSGCVAGSSRPSSGGVWQNLGTLLSVTSQVIQAYQSARGQVGSKSQPRSSPVSGPAPGAVTTPRSSVARSWPTVDTSALQACSQAWKRYFQAGQLVSACLS